MKSKRLTRRPSYSESGAILPIVIILMLALTITGIAFLSASVLEHSLAMREVHKNQAFFLADAGIDHLTFKLYHWEQPTLIGPTPLGDGEYQVVADYDPTPPDEPFAISTGQRLKDAEVKAEQKIRVTIDSEGIFSYAVFADESITMTGVAFVDGDIGTNSIEDSAITLTPGTTVAGNAVVGPDGDPNEVISGEENITGELDALAEKIPMEPYPLPPGLIGLPDSGPLTVGGGDVVDILGTGGPYYYSEMTVNGVLNIDGPCTFLVDRLRTQGGGGAGIININVGSPDSVVFYITDEATLAGSGIVNVNLPPDATTLYIYGTETCSSISFSGSRDFVGAVYAPKADISCTGGAHIIGSLVGNTIDINGNPDVIYDDKLGGDDEPSYFVLRDWQQVF